MNKIKQTLVFFALMIGVCSFLAAPLALAAKGDTCGSTKLKEGESCCAGVPTSILSCGGSNTPSSDPSQSGIWILLTLIINILTAGVAAAALGGVVYGSIMYTTARANAEQVKKARVIIANTVIGIVAYVLMYSLMNYLIPGGLFS